ncbi:hypothetical protein M9Y10_011076 [Tritrichomonas musculus]|uniref:Uncharacterized protein n=1 Tax=Tritrichomonas musculus TaxID=1915356 RepID=A0ABR2INN4_9EUKA
MQGLNIHMKSFKLSTGIVNENDKVRVSITTFPEQFKEAFIIEAKQMNCAHHFFTVNITDKTQKIVFVFRKKEAKQDPIVASTTININQLPAKNKATNLEMKTIKIYEPVQNGNKNRKVYGEMQVQFSLTTAFSSIKANRCIEKVYNEDENHNLYNLVYMGDLY